jgi:hypothetical protein
MKDGTVVEGKIVGRDNDSIVVQQGSGFPQKYYKADIGVIEEDVTAKDYGEGIPTVDQLKPEQKQLVRQLLEAAGVRATLQANLENVIKNAPEDKKTDFLIALNADDLLERIIPIYAKYYTNEELKALLSFYQSPVGKKFLEVSPLVAQDTVTVAIDYFKEKLEPQE